MQFSKCRLKLDVVSSAFSLVQDYNTFIYERLLSTLVANVARVALPLKRTLVGGRRFRSNVAAVNGRRFPANFGHLEFMYFGVQQPSELSVEERNLLSSANKFPSCWCCGISVHAPTSLCCCVCTARKLSTDQEESRNFVQTSGFTFGDNVTHFCDSFQCSRMLRTVEHLFLLVSSIFCMAQGGYFHFVTCAH